MKKSNKKPVSKFPTQVPAILLIVFLGLLTLNFAYGAFNPMQVVNAHESIETLEDAKKLENTMTKLGMIHTVLHAIPESYLRYEEGTQIDLSNVDENQNLIKELLAEKPEKFSYVCGIDTAGADRLIRLEECLKDQAVGVKIYNGYARSHFVALNDPALDDFYKRMAETNLVLFGPVNLTLFEDELSDLLEKNKSLNVVCSHYCLAGEDLKGLTNLMRTFPNLWVDTSFGSLNLALQGFEEISQNRSEFLAFFNEFQDKILFATDNVITSYEDKNEDFVNGLYTDYLSILQERSFKSALNSDLKYEGLALPVSIQKKVFLQNWKRLLNSLAE